MKDGKIIIARLWTAYRGQTSSRAPVILGFDRAKYRTICIYLTKESDEPNYFEQAGCKVFYISSRKLLCVLRPLVIGKLAKLLKDQGVDILHCHRHKASTCGALAARLAGIPIVFAHVHGLNRTRSIKRKLTNWFTLRYTSKILTVGQATKQDVLSSNYRLHPDKVISLGNSIDHRRFTQADTNKTEAKKRLGLNQGTFVFGTIGRLVPTKGYSYLIEAFVKVKQSVPSAHLVFVGDGCLRMKLENIAKQSKIAESVHFLGKRDDIPKILQAFDVFVLSSIAEGMPRSLLEAMASSLPCVATDVGSIGEILAEGKFGHMVAPGDTESLAKAMTDLAKKPAANRREMAENAKQRILDEYNHNVIRKRLENIYEAEYKSIIG